MRDAALLTLCFLAMGCGQWSGSSGSGDPSQQPSPPPTDPSASKPVHVEMPVQDIAVEAEQHCSSALARFKAAKSKLDDALRHGNADEIHYKVKKLDPELNLVQSDLERCQEAAHGFYEKSLGKEPPPAQR